MPMWTYALKFSLRSLGRELLRNFWGRTFVYPTLIANERSAATLAAYRSHRAAAIGIELDGDTAGDGAGDGGATRLPRLTGGQCAGLLTKQDVRRHPRRLVRPRSPLRPGAWLRTTIQTSGTSGSPLTIVQSAANPIREEGFVYRQLRWIGYRHGQRRAWIRGDIVCPDHPHDGRYWCRDWVGNMLMMSSYHLSNHTIEGYVDALERFDPVVIHAYPSSVAALAAWLDAAGRRYRGAALRGVMTSSETLEPAVRAQVEQAFGVRVFDWYGQAERVAAIGTCEQGRYHVLTDYADVALLHADNDADGNADRKTHDDGRAELVGTTLNNAAMPLQRYRTGDDVVPDGTPCPCGRVFPTVKAVIGRQERILTLPDGRIVARLDRVFQGHDRRLLEGQVLYRGGFGFVLRVVATDGFTDADASTLIDKFLLRVPGADVSVQRVDAIARGPNGKFEFIAIAAGANDTLASPSSASASAAAGS